MQKILWTINNEQGRCTPNKRFNLHERFFRPVQTGLVSLQFILRHRDTNIVACYE